MLVRVKTYHEQAILLSIVLMLPFSGDFFYFKPVIRRVQKHNSTLIRFPRFYPCLRSMFAMQYGQWKQSMYSFVIKKLFCHSLPSQL